MARRDDVDRPAAVETPSPRRDGREPPEAAPTEEALATLQRLRETRPDLDADLDQVIATVEHLQLEVSGLRFALVARATIDAAKGILIAEHGCDEDCLGAFVAHHTSPTRPGSRTGRRVPSCPGCALTTRRRAADRSALQENSDN